VIVRPVNCQPWALAAAVDLQVGPIRPSGRGCATCQNTSMRLRTPSQPHHDFGSREWSRTLFLMRLCRFWFASFLLRCAAATVRGWLWPAVAGASDQPLHPFICPPTAASMGCMVGVTHLAALPGCMRWTAALVAIGRTGR
jgi:hypothetical protein